MSSAWENCAESCNLIFAPTLSRTRGQRYGLPDDGHRALLDEARPAHAMRPLPPELQKEVHGDTGD